MLFFYKPRSIKFFVAAYVLLSTPLVYAETIKVNGNQIITKSMTYKNVKLDMTHGSFTIKNNAVIDIENSTVDVTISPSNPFYIYLTSGSVTLKNNVFNVVSSGIIQNPNIQSPYKLIQVDKGDVTITDNTFTIDTPYTVALFTTNIKYLTNGFQIQGNKIKNFHGGIYLANSNNAEIDNNVFTNVSFSNIFNNGNINNYHGNAFIFPGNLKLGNAFDIVNSDTVNLVDNIISSGSNYGIFILGSKNILLDNNKITDGLSYGIFIQTPTFSSIKNDKYLSNLLPKQKLNFYANDTITITNNIIAQNRYGLAGGVISNLTVEKNTFIQRFADSKTRQFWTNNHILLPSVTNLIWQNNLYKEAFTQEVPGNNNLSLQFVYFPPNGGVSLS